MSKVPPTYFFEAEAGAAFETDGVQIGYRVKKKLYEGMSAYQSVRVFDLVFFGRALFLDSILQTAEKDEFVYHEMLCQSPLFCHKNPERVLIIGGGDGGSLREVVKHKEVREVWMVEIDKDVMDVSRKYLPALSQGAFQDPRARVLVEDAARFIKRHKSFFDVIILDVSDPEGPAAKLVSPGFYKNVREALREKGVVCAQSGSFTTQSVLVRRIQKRLREQFAFVEVRRACVPSYHAGVYSFTMASRAPLSLAGSRSFQEQKAASMGLRYWSPAIHKISSVLPAYLEGMLEDCL